MKIQVSITLNESTVAKVKAQAEKESRSFSQMIDLILTKTLQK